MPVRLLFSFALVVAGCTVLSGCGPASATISGEVTVDGQPVELGAITFSPGDEVPGIATAELKNGKYQIKTLVGKKNVMISALKVIDKRKESAGPDSPWVDITEERLPERFNSKTELTFEVKAGANHKDWHLETGVKKP